MPTYEYACSDCGEHVEVFQSFSDEPLATCSNCGGSLRKVFGSIGIVLKGSGFYRTDSRSAGRKGATSSESTKEAAPADAAPAKGASEGSAASSASKEPASKEPASKERSTPSPAPKAAAAG